MPASARKETAVRGRREMTASRRKKTAVSRRKTAKLWREYLWTEADAEKAVPAGQGHRKVKAAPVLIKL